MTSTPPDIFDRRRRRLLRDRAARAGDRIAPLFDHAAAELLGRLAEADRLYPRALDLGCRDGRLGGRLPADVVVSMDAGFGFAHMARGAQAEEDRLPFPESSFDLIASVGALQAVNDLPGALIQLRRALRSGGQLAAVMLGGDSLGTLRRALAEAEEALTGGVSPRVHPTVDPREAPALLQRAGFARPVVDVEPLTLRYRDLAGLTADLRAWGETRLLTAPARRLTREAAALAMARFAAQADTDGRVLVRVELIHLSGYGA